MRVTRDEHPERIDRFAHIPRAPRGRPTCPGECPGTGDGCTRERGHPGPHVAHGRMGRLRAAWDAPVPGAAPTRSPIDGGYAGPRLRRDRGPIRRTWEGFADRFLASFPEALMLIFFIAFVFFAIGWGLQML